MTYNEFINDIVTTRGQWNISIKEDLCERHHIIPKCKGGKPYKLTWKQHQNVIWLTPREHYIAHRLLAEENPNDFDLVLAWSMMAFPKGKTNRKNFISENDYQELRKKLSEGLKKNPVIRKNPPWNKGLTKETDQRVLAMSIKRTGQSLGKRSDEFKKAVSLATRLRYLQHPETFQSKIKGKVAIHNNNNNKICYYINKEDQLPEGFSYGQGKHKSYNIKDLNYIHELRSKQNSGENNPMYGKGYKLSGGNNGKAIYIYTYKNIDYQCRDDLVKELVKEFPDITGPIIRSIMLDKCSKKTIVKYKYVINNLSWRLKKDENKVDKKDSA